MEETLAPERIGHLLNKVCHRRHRRMHELLESLGLYRGQPSMLRALWAQDGMTHTELAAGLNRNPATITKMVQRMEKAGFVQRRTDSRDERVSLVYLTDAGRDIKTAVENVWSAFEARTLAGLSEQERAELSRLLLRICQNLKHDS
jgi:DNA-binding MarR family transcriptional regulator